MALNNSELDDVIYLVTAGQSLELLDDLKELIVYLKKLPSQLELQSKQSHGDECNGKKLNQLVDYQLIQKFFPLKPININEVSSTSSQCYFENQTEQLKLEQKNNSSAKNNVQCEQSSSLLNLYNSKIDKLKHIIMMIPMPDNKYLLLFVQSSLYAEKLRTEMHNLNLPVELTMGGQLDKMFQIPISIIAVILISDKNTYIIRNENNLSNLNIENSIFDSINFQTIVNQIFLKIVNQENLISICKLNLRILQENVMYFILELKGDLLNLNYNKYLNDNIKNINPFETTVDGIDGIVNNNSDNKNEKNLKKRKSEDLTKFASVDLSNIVGGKRSRKTVSNLQLIEAKTNNNNAEKRDKHKLAMNFIYLKNIHIHNPRLTLFCYFQYAFSLTLANCEEELKTNFDNVNQKIYGPLPKSPLFKSYAFILTAGRAPSMRSEEEKSIPFYKEYLIKQIVSGMGCIFTSTSQIAFFNCLKFVCLIPCHTRSVKYISCLAYGVPTINYQWVIDCCNANKIIPMQPYTIPDSFYIKDYSSINRIVDRSQVFRNVKFFFGSAYPIQLYDFLFEPLLAARAAVYPKNKHEYNINILDCIRVDIIIADSTCPLELIRKAKLMKIPLASPEYVVQCIFTGTKLPVDSLPSFAYDYEKIL